jgi:hypothetical protein
MALGNPDRDYAYRVYDLIGHIDHRPVGWRSRAQRRLDKLSPAWGSLLIVGVGVGLFAGALGGVLIALAGNGSFVAMALGVPVMIACAVVAAHLTPPRISELRE